MPGVRDLYELLGVPRDASQEEIKKAYRRLARELHPDVNPGDSPSEERFKQVTAAYEILSDPEKRRQYDTFGSMGGPDMGFPFGDVGDIFEMFFGGGFGTAGRRRTRQRRTRAQRGEDLYMATALTFEEAATGARRELQVEKLDLCGRCGGEGAEPGTGPSRCRTCGGSGDVQEMRRSIFGTVMTSQTCPVCLGSGEEILSPCAGCAGDGRVAQVQTLPVDVPAGVADGLELRMAGAGHAGRHGGPPGDLYVSVRVESSPVYERRGQDLFTVLCISLTQAALGADVTIDTLDGEEQLRLDPGTQSGAVLRLKGRGMPHVNRRGRGDLFVTVRVEVPKKLSREERRLLEQLAAVRGEAVGKSRTARGTLEHP